MKKSKLFFVGLLLFSLGSYAQSQDENVLLIKQKEAEQIVANLDQKAENLIEDLDKATEKYLAKLLREEKKLRERILQKDSALAIELFSGVEENYKRVLSASTKANRFTQHYSSHLDSLSTALSFLKEKNLPVSPKGLNQALSHYNELQSKLNQTDNVKRFIADRRKQLSQHLQNFGPLKQLNSFKKKAYYYAAQVKEYKAHFEDPSKWEQKLMALALGIPQFKKFFSQNSLLASLFPLPGSGVTTPTTASFQGLQTRVSLQQTLQTQFGSNTGFTQALQNNVQEAQGQLNQLKTKLTSLSQGSFGNQDQVELPEGFKPNNQKTKTFLDRLEYGANVQSKRANSFIPITTDLGLSLGYKLSDEASFGVGTAYTLGWGRRITNLRFTSEGIGLRSYLDMKLKGSIYVSGGYEMNYRPLVPQRIDFTNMGLASFDSWQKSGLIGLSKKYKVSKKLKGDIRLLWDFLSYVQVPRTQALLFRIGYSFK